jgi:Na+/H+ antiporter NhaC
MLPVSVFAAAAAIAFATGTSWATMAILIPLVIPLAATLGAAGGLTPGEFQPLLFGTVSSVLAGAIFGDHCSPISDTTVLSSMASASDHVDHVRTQLPYAMLVAMVGMLIGDIPTAYGMPWIVSYVVGIAILFAVLWFVGKPSQLRTSE